MSESRTTTVAQVVAEHVAAFTAHDTDRLLAGLTEDVRWETGRDLFTGKASLAEVFDDGLWALDPSLKIRRLVADAASAAAELVEHLTVDGARRTFAIAAFFDVRDGLISAAKVYREGSADID